jgi:Cupin
VPAITGVPDAMSDVLSLVRMRAEIVCANEYSAPWSFSFRLPMAHFHIVERGTAWLSVDQREPVRLEMGDLAILPLGTGHVLGNDPGVPPVPIDEAMRSAAVRHGAAVYQLGGGGERTHVLCGRFSFAGVLAPKLLTVLPPLIHLETRSGETLEWLRLTSHFLIEETRDPKPGSAIMLARLLDLLFVQAVREWGAKSPNNLGWVVGQTPLKYLASWRLSGLNDARIGKALSAIHEEPSHPWTVEHLAEIAGFSRSAFAARFTSSTNGAR